MPNTNANPPTHLQRLFPVSPYTLFTWCTAWLTKYPTQSLCLSILLLSAAYQQPDFLPTTDELTVALLSFLCGGLLIFTAIVLEDYFETLIWPWQVEGCVWPWQRWFWHGTVDEEENEVVQEDGGAVLEPTTVRGYEQAEQDVVIPPTPLLPGGLRPAVDLQPPINASPAQIHRSGLLGESPMPTNKFKHFSGNGFHKRERMRYARMRGANAGTAEERKKEMLAFGGGG